MTIGDVARAAGVQASAIRYYEDSGLLPLPDRIGGRRRYHSSVLERLAILEFAKKCGFRLAEVRSLLHDHADDAPLARRIYEMAQRRLAELDREEKAIALRRARIERAMACRCADFAECCRRVLARKRSEGL